MKNLLFNPQVAHEPRSFSSSKQENPATRVDRILQRWDAAKENLCRSKNYERIQQQVSDDIKLLRQNQALQKEIAETKERLSCFRTINQAIKRDNHLEALKAIGLEQMRLINAQLEAERALKDVVTQRELLGSKGQFKALNAKCIRKRGKMRLCEQELKRCGSSDPLVFRDLQGAYDLYWQEIKELEDRMHREQNYISDWSINMHELSQQSRTLSAQIDLINGHVKILVDLASKIHQNDPKLKESMRTLLKNYKDRTEGYDSVQLHMVPSLDVLFRQSKAEGFQKSILLITNSIARLEEIQIADKWGWQKTLHNWESQLKKDKDELHSLKEIEYLKRNNLEDQIKRCSKVIEQGKKALESIRWVELDNPYKLTTNTAKVEWLQKWEPITDQLEEIMQLYLACLSQKNEDQSLLDT